MGTVKRAASTAGSRAGASMLIALYVVEAAVFLGAMILYKHQPEPFLTVLTGRHGPIFAAAIVAAVTAGAYIVHLFLRVPANDRRALWLTTWMNATSIAILVVLAEGVVRLAARETARGLSVGNTVL